MVESTKLTLSRIAEMVKFPGFAGWVPVLAPNDLYVALVENDKLIKVVSQGCLMTSEIVARINRLNGKIYYFKETSSVDLGISAGKALRFFENSKQSEDGLDPMPNEVSARVRDVFMHHYKGHEKLDKRKFFLGLALGLECIPFEESFEQVANADLDRHLNAIEFAAEAVAALVVNGLIEKNALEKIIKQIYGKCAGIEKMQCMVSLLGSTRDLAISEELADQLWAWDKNAEFFLARKRFKEWTFDVAI